MKNMHKINYLMITIILVLCFALWPSRTQYPPDCVGGYAQTYFNYTLDQCRYCHSSCQNCSGETMYNCTNCSLPYYLFNNTCVSKCPDRYYKSNATHQCLPCNAGCNKTCDGPLPQNCTDCPTGQTLLEGNCSTKVCPYNGYIRSSDNSCQVCNSECATCNGGSRNNCTLCSRGTTL
jgi:proprotein convertase subtilisin/kexin type 5